MYEYGLIVFTSRQHAMSFYNQSKIRSRLTVMSTPMEISHGCSLSIKFPLLYTGIVKRELYTKRYLSVQGVYHVQSDGCNNTYTLMTL
ncbi:MAG TPA: DUF3343 domain-containing protein [Clostridiales bacterium]|nr:DUF3343 domain-containing protein [Clostridiales bacterium]